MSQSLATALASLPQIPVLNSLHSLQPPWMKPRTFEANQRLNSREGAGSLFHARKNPLRHPLGERAR